MYLLVPFIMPRDIVDELNLIRNTLPYFSQVMLLSFTVLLTAAKPVDLFRTAVFYLSWYLKCHRDDKKILRQYRNLYFQLENSTAIQTTSYAKILMELISIVCNDLRYSPHTKGYYCHEGIFGYRVRSPFASKEKRSFFPKRGCNFTFLYHLKRSKDKKRNVRIPSVFSSDQLQVNFFPYLSFKKVEAGLADGAAWSLRFEVHWIICGFTSQQFVTSPHASTKNIPIL